MITGKTHFLVPIVFGNQEIPAFLQDLYVVRCLDSEEQSLDKAVMEIDEAIGDHLMIAKAKRKKAERVFIGHGRSQTWLELKDFLQNRLNLECEEFNRQPVAGLSTTQRLQEMLDASVFAFNLNGVSSSCHREKKQA